MHGLGAADGVVVGTTATQTLTNKTLTSPILTGAGVDASIVFEGANADAHETTLTVAEPTQDNTITLPNTTGTVVIVDAAQTLTNKTLTSPTISGTPVITGLSSAGMVSTSATPKDYVDSILGSATSAATSAASAAASATAAATSASSAATSASLAATSASSASTSQTAAATSAASAATSATAAATSATSAAASATAAATSASSAAAATSAVATSAASALASQTAAATSASSAATSASSALTSQTAAATSATAAATSATSAAASATAAATSATSAAASATAAASSAVAAAAAVTSAIQLSTIDAKGDLIVGTANDAVGRLGVGTNGQILTADSAETTGLKWTAAPSGYTAPTIGTTTITSGATVSTLTSVALDSASLTGTVTAGGSAGTSGYVLSTTGTGVQWAAVAGSLAQPTEPSSPTDGQIWVDTDGTALINQLLRWSKATANGTTTLSGNDDNSVPLTYSVGYEQVFQNGALLARGGDYTATNGTTISLTNASVTGDIFEVFAAQPVAISDVYTQAQANAAFINDSLLDAKGDLVVASAADTPARLAVGGDYGFLQANSGAATGIEWNATAWTAYTPTISSNGGTITTATAAGYWIRIGKLCVVRSSWNITTNGTASISLNLSLPFTGAAAGIGSTGVGREYAVAGKQLQIEIGSSDTVMRFRNYDNTYPGGNGYAGTGTICYEVA
jgi:hypothetical protein